MKCLLAPSSLIHRKGSGMSVNRGSLVLFYVVVEGVGTPYGIFMVKTKGLDLVRW